MTIRECLAWSPISPLRGGQHADLRFSSAGHDSRRHQICGGAQFITERRNGIQDRGRTTVATFGCNVPFPALWRAPGGHAIPAARMPNADSAGSAGAVFLAWVTSESVTMAYDESKLLRAPGAAVGRQIQARIAANRTATRYRRTGGQWRKSVEWRPTDPYEFIVGGMSKIEWLAGQVRGMRPSATSANSGFRAWRAGGKSTATTPAYAQLSTRRSIACAEPCR
jgi:hypothetical protein